ncbi:MAG: hypothetical protein LBM60_04735, partial [Clostridium sp.]|nr:hypothetical protein [Clostridium sp.]
MLDILNEARVPMQSESAPSMPIPQSTPNQPTPLKQPTDVQPMFTQPVDSQPMNTQPMNAQPMNAQPMDAQPMNAQPMNAQPIFMPQPFPPNFTPNIPNQPLNPPPVPMQQALNANNAPMQQPFPPSFTPYMPDQPVTNPGVHAPYIPPRPMNMPQYQQPVYASYRSTPVKERYIPSPPDGIMAYFMIILGYLFTRYILFRWTGWGVSVQILLMLILTVWYGFSSAALRGEKLGRNAWLWSGVTLAIALSYAFFLAPGINVYRTLFLIMAYLQLILHL